MAFAKHSVGLSFQYAVALTLLANILAIDSKFLRCSVDTGLILVLPLNHEVDSVGVAMKSYLKIMLLFW